jgi:hypothetical protein
MVCHCGRTVLMPPIPCGTRLRCAHPCTRPPPACGHSRTPHACHDDATACPPCPFLTSKQCACGKKAVGNVRCSQEKVSCGISCGKLLACGFHKCTRLCHGDSCGPCANTCGKPRKNWCVSSWRSRGCRVLMPSPVFRSFTRARSRAMRRPLARNLSHAWRRSRSLVRAGA